MRTFLRLRILIVWIACLTAGVAAGILIAIHIVQRSLYGVPPDSTTGITFSFKCLYLVPAGAAAGGLVALITVSRLRRKQVIRSHKA